MHLRYRNQEWKWSWQNTHINALPSSHMFSRCPGRKFSGILNMLIAQHNDDSKPKPQIGKFLSPEQHSVCSSERVKQIQMGTRTSFVKF